MHGSLWNKERDQALKQLRADGLSFNEVRSEINHKFGTNYSRNACIGRAKRLGLTQTPVEIALSRAKAAVRREEVKQLQREGLAPVRRRRRQYSVAPEIREEIATAPPIAPSSLPVGSIAFKTLHAIKAKADRPCEPDMRPMRCVAIEPKHLTIMDLTKYTCRWPYGGWPENKPITFCGHWCPKEAPYCEAHEALSAGFGTPSERAAHRVSGMDKAA